MTGLNNDLANWDKPIFLITKELADDGGELIEESTDSLEILDQD